MLALTRRGLDANYRQAAALTKRHLSQDHFSAHFEEARDWAIGPFDRDSSLTFTPSGQWPDPTGIGWTASAIFNPSLIRHDGRLGGVLPGRAEHGVHGEPDRHGRPRSRSVND